MKRQIVGMVTGFELSDFRAGNNAMISYTASRIWDKLKEDLAQDCINPMREDAIVTITIEWRGE